MNGETNVALVVPDDVENGPEEFKISPEAEVTVTIYRDGKVEATHAYGKGELSQAQIDAILKDTGKILK